ncbi:carbonic anhydrase [Sphingomonas oryzagri]
MIVDDASEPISDLLRRNRSWAERKTASDPGFFARLVGQQRPRYFWIGCADSRVPATEIVDLDPGEMFVHRNVANLARSDDANFSAALSYAIETLEIDDILLVGHYGCGGIEAVLGGTDGKVARWLTPIREMYDRRAGDLAALRRGAKLDRLCELNVIEQARALSNHPIVVTAWANGRALSIYGLIYGVGDGLIGHVCTGSKSESASPRIAVHASYECASERPDQLGEQGADPSQFIAMRPGE